MLKHNSTVLRMKLVYSFIARNLFTPNRDQFERLNYSGERGFE